MHRLVRLSALMIAAAAIARPAVAQESGGLEARVWLDRGDEPVLRQGEDVRVYYRTSEDAFAAIFRIDTDGRVHLLYPQHPDAVDIVRGARDYRLLFPHAPSWRVEEDPGVGYFFIVASPEPLDFSSFPYDERYGWDVSAVGGAVYTDPYVAIDDYVARIVPAWEQVPYALDFVTYSVGATYSYPRFLCYDCHSYQRYSTWNPYDYTCSTFRVVIWDDPYFYPRYRYSGVNVVVATRPVRASLPRYEVTRRVLGDPVRPVIRTRAAVERRVVEYKEPVTPVERSGVERTAAERTAVARSSALAVAQERPRGAAPQQVPDTSRARPTLQRRPSARLPVRTPPSARPAQPESTPTRAAPSRLPVRTPSGRPSGAPAEPRDPPPAATSRPSGREPVAAPAPSQSPRAAPSTRTAPRAGPTIQREPPGGTAAPPRPSVRSVPAPGSSSGGSSRPQAAPPRAAPRTQAAPPRSSGGSSRPSASPAPSRPQSSPPARAAAPPRSSEPRPSVRPRAAEPRE